VPGGRRAAAGAAPTGIPAVPAAAIRERGARLTTLGTRPSGLGARRPPDSTPEGAAPPGCGGVPAHPAESSNSK